jgi:hypothetical protein
VGAGNGEQSRWSGEGAMRRQGDRRCGARKEQTHGGLEERKGEMEAARAAAEQGFWPPSKGRRTWVLAASVETRKSAQAEAIRRGANGTRRISKSPKN